MDIKHINKSPVRGQDVSSQRIICLRLSKPGKSNNNFKQDKRGVPPVHFYLPICCWSIRDFWSNNKRTSADLALKCFNSSGVVFLMTRLYQSSDLDPSPLEMWHQWPLKWSSGWFKLVQAASWSMAFHGWWRFIVTGFVLSHVTFVVNTVELVKSQDSTGARRCLIMWDPYHQKYKKTCFFFHGTNTSCLW